MNVSEKKSIMMTNIVVRRTHPISNYAYALNEGSSSSSSSIDEILNFLLSD